MNILAFDTSMKACSAAVLAGSASPSALFHTFEELERGHMERLVPMIEQVMEEAGLAYQDLDRIAVTTGPGTFTGVRIGLACARALALAANLPLVGATSLCVMASAVRDQLEALADGSHLDRPLAIAVDARREQIYFQLFSSDLAPMTEPAALTLEDAVNELPQCAILAAGSASLCLAEIADQSGRKVRAVAVKLQPDAAVLARLAQDLAPAQEPVRPLYLRNPDAKPQFDKVLPRR
ncbi:tRNA threonylcarbamoyladenosine biosynthesis protein TsaB [bacterium MnTg02]|nr:tRNA threonylcarbamoyladenosine biosynthesis protein TsaB [bacterium MnTg02]